MKKLLFLFVIVFTLVMSVGCGKEKEFNFEDGKLVVGLEAAYSPFNWTETSATETNHPISGTNLYVDGYDVQIAKLLAADLGLELEIKKVQWESLVQSLKTGMIDVIIAGMSPTENRMKSISFTDKYYESTHVVVLKNDSQFANAKTFSDFSGANVVGQRGTLYDNLAKQLADKGSAKYQAALDSIPLIVNALNTGMSDVTVLEEPVAKSIVAQNNKFTYIHLESPFDISEEDKIVSIGVRKGDNELRERLNSALAKISEEKRASLMDAAVLQGTGK